MYSAEHAPVLFTSGTLDANWDNLLSSFMRIVWGRVKIEIIFKMIIFYKIVTLM